MTQWDRLPLSNAEIVNLVNLRMISSHHDYSAYHIIAMRDYDKTFMKINNQVRVHKQELIKRELAKAQNARRKASIE